MLKCSNYKLLNKLKKLFNLVLDSGYFPKNWNHGYFPKNWNHGMIYTIYKSGPKFDYCGITLASYLGKLFRTLLHVRIKNEV